MVHGALAMRYLAASYLSLVRKAETAGYERARLLKCKAASTAPPPSRSRSPVLGLEGVKMVACWTFVFSFVAGGSGVRTVFFSFTHGRYLAFFRYTDQ